MKKPRLSPKGKRLGYKPEDTEANKQLFLSALKKNLGLILRASKATGICSMTHYLWMDKDPVYKENVEKMIELKRDFVEHHLQNLVRKEDSTCTTFAARSLLRKRGYEQSVPLTNGDEGKPFELAIDTTAISTILKTIYGSTQATPIKPNLGSDGPPKPN